VVAGTAIWGEEKTSGIKSLRSYMAKDDRVLLKLNYPKWFRIFYGVGAPLTLLLFIIGWVHFSRNGFTSLELLKSALFLVIVGFGLYVSPVFYYSVVATEAGLQFNGVFGPKQQFAWNEIATVSRPRLGIPKEAIYIYSRSGEKTIIGRGMTGYSDLLELIQSRAPNLSPKELPRELLPSASSGEWKYVLIFFGLFIIYVIVRLIFKF
jgi:hypothetical protein